MEYNKSGNSSKMKSVENVSSGTSLIMKKTLQPPYLQDGLGFLEPKNGVWDARKVLVPVTLLLWGFIVIDEDGLEPGARDKAIYEKMMLWIEKYGYEMGILVSTLPTWSGLSVPPQCLMRILMMLKAMDLTLLFIVLPFRRRSYYYHQIKKITECHLGIMTQCIQYKTTRNLKPAIIRGLLRKVNAKLGGVNHVYHLPGMPSFLPKDKRIMVVGGHILRPSAQQLRFCKSNVPSIAAVALSIDYNCTKYNLELSIQKGKIDEIVDLQSVIYKNLVYYMYKRLALPTTIIYFRSHIPTTSDNEVEYLELDAIYAAFKRANEHFYRDKPIRPNIIYVVVETPRKAKLRTLNVSMPMELKSRYIVNNFKNSLDTREINFSIVSQQPANRRSCMSHYSVFNDEEVQFELEQLTYYLCHVCVSGARPLSVPAPLFYAQLGGKRALSLIYGRKFDLDLLETKAQRLHISFDLLFRGYMFFI